MALRLCMLHRISLKYLNQYINQSSKCIRQLGSPSDLHRKRVFLKGLCIDSRRHPCCLWPSYSAWFLSTTALITPRYLISITQLVLATSYASWDRLLTCTASACFLKGSTSILAHIQVARGSQTLYVPLIPLKYLIQYTLTNLANADASWRRLLTCTASACFSLGSASILAHIYVACGPQTL
jgi:hypothetical protein